MRNSSENTEPADKRRKFIEGVDYYFDDGLIVMTEHYLLERGFCCGNGCRHCPYEVQAVSE